MQEDGRGPEEQQGHSQPAEGKSSNLGSHRGEEPRLSRRAQVLFAGGFSWKGSCVPEWQRNCQAQQIKRSAKHQSSASGKAVSHDQGRMTATQHQRHIGRVPKTTCGTPWCCSEVILTGGPGGPGWPISPLGPVGPCTERRKTQHSCNTLIRVTKMTQKAEGIVCQGSSKCALNTLTAPQPRPACLPLPTG